MLVLLVSFAMTGCASARESAGIIPQWTLEDDLAFLREEAARSADGSALLPYLTNASERNSYSSIAEAFSERSGNCGAWMVLQTININENEFNAILFCRRAGSWLALTDGRTSHGIAEAEARVLDDVLSSFTNEIVDSGCDAITDASAIYISAFVGDRILRQAVYAPGSIIGGCRDSLGSRKVVANVDALRNLADGSRP